MIIRNKRRRFPGGRIVLGLVVAAALVGLFFLLIDKEETAQTGDPYLMYQTSAEDTAGVQPPGAFKRTVYFVEGRDSFMNGETFSDVAARTGKHSSAPRQGMPYGIGFEFRNLMGGEVYTVTIWRNSHSAAGELILDADWGAYEKGVTTGKVEGDWEEMRIRFKVPFFVNQGTAKAYTYNPEQDYVYFDDLAIHRVKGPKGEDRGDLPEDSIRTINLVIEDRHWEKLERKRKQAFNLGVLKTEDGDFVPARIEEGGKSYKASLRLKGDWTDHLLGDKWSFRIKMAKGQAWNRFTAFSVQSPHTRSFLMEYVFHEMLLQEGLLAPRYDFIHLKINGETRGVYAVEEHFEKQIPEYNKRREGPILKFVEDGFWDVFEKWDSEKYPEMDQRIAMYPSAQTEPFHLKRYLKDSVLAEQVKMAQDLMHAYKHAERTVWEVFDAEKVAKYYAIVDMLKAHHGFIWHNQRLYYNPIISKLEPVGYDGYTETGPLIWIKKPFIGYGRNFRYMTASYKGLMFERFFHDYKFVARYVHYLELYTRESFIEQFMEEMESKLALREVLFQKEWPGYEYDRNFILSEAKKIRMALFPLPKTSIKAYQQEATQNSATYRIFNYHCLPVKMLGVGDDLSGIKPFTVDTLLPSYANDFPPEMTDLKATGTGKYIFFEVPGLDSVFHSEILPWEAPGGPTPEQELFSDLTISSNDIYEVNEATKEVHFRAGKYQTKEHILIPPGYSVNFDAGVELDLVQSAMFISKSKVTTRGTEARPVHIYSSDKTGRGFTVLQVPDGEKSEFKHTAFEGLRALKYKAWELTGAVTVYESECYFLNCRFVNNDSEDGLNIVRSVFNLTYCYVGNTASDGFDADFCTGTIDHCTFYNTTNDGMDFSGSELYIAHARVEKSGDKALSIGEESKAKVVHLEIKDSQAGIASKDFSEVNVEFVSMDDVNQGFTIYQKKPEYGPADMNVKNYTADGVSQLYQVQKGCVLNLKGKRIEGKW